MASSNKRRMWFVRMRLSHILIIVTVFAAVTFGSAALVTGPATVFSDSVSYNIAAQRLVYTGTFEINGIPELEVQNGPSAWTMPGYTIFLTPFYVVTGITDDVVVNIEHVRSLICFAQYLLAVSSATILSACGFLVAGKRGAWVAGILTALYIPLGINAMYIGTETVAFFGTALCLLLALLMLHASTRRRIIVWSACYGIAGGLLVMVRPTILPWLAIPFLFLAWTQRKRLKTAVIVVAIGGLAIIAVMAPWTVRNAIVFGEFIPLMNASSSPLLESTGDIEFSPEEEVIAAQAMQEGKDANRAVAHHRLAEHWQRSPRGFMRWKAMALYASMIEYPNMPRASWRMYESVSNLSEAEQAGYNLTVVESARYRGPDHITNKVLDVFATGYHRVLLVIALLGFALSLKKRDAWLVASLPVFFFAAHSYFLVEPRYLYYNVTAYVLLATLGIAWMLKRVTQ